MSDGTSISPVIVPERQFRGGGKPGRSSRKASRLLRDLRWVYEHPEDENATPGQKILQKLFREKAADFVAQLREAEADHAKTVPPAVPEAPARLTCSNPEEFAWIKEHVEHLVHAEDTAIRSGGCVTVHSAVILSMSWLVDEVDRLLTGSDLPGRHSRRSSEPGE